jgi:hypothetical protein
MSDLIEIYLFTAENALTSPQGDSTQTASQASTTATYDSAANSYNALSYDWSSFAACSTTCGQGYKRRIRRCDVPQRCSDKIEEDVQLCYNAPCEGTIKYNTIQYNTIQYDTIRYNTIQYNAIQYNTIQYNTIQ